jgi:hypothetical protein
MYRLIPVFITVLVLANQLLFVAGANCEPGVDSISPGCECVKVKGGPGPKKPCCCPNIPGETDPDLFFLRGCDYYHENGVDGTCCTPVPINPANCLFP